MALLNDSNSNILILRGFEISRFRFVFDIPIFRGFFISSFRGFEVSMLRYFDIFGFQIVQYASTRFLPSLPVASPLSFQRPSLCESVPS